MDDVTTTFHIGGLSEKEALERVVNFDQRFGPQHADLAVHAAFPLVLTPDLLYRIWASFLPQIPWTTVSDILLSPLCREVGYELYEMDPAIRNILLGELREDSRFGESRLQELAGFLKDYIKLNMNSEEPDQRHLAEAQRLTALVYISPDEAAREIASRLSDPSQLRGAELIRVATLTESLFHELRDFSDLVHYARGVERLAHGDQKTASNLLKRVFAEKEEVEVAGVTLQRPGKVAEIWQAEKSGRKFSRYEIRSELGIGGMSTVYHGYDPAFERDVAIKVLKHKRFRDPGVRKRFEREVKIVAKLEHAAIVPVYDVGYDNNQLFYVMRYMRGGSLFERINEGKLDLEQLSNILLRLASALDYAHSKGIVHGDLKPGNILFDLDDNAYISDFGIPKIIQAANSVTDPNIITGTPRYMSPEQARGEEIDDRSDIYTLGVIFFEILGGRAPFETSIQLTVMKHAIEPAPNILDVNPNLPQGLRYVLDKTLQKDPAARYQTCTEFANAFLEVISASTVRKDEFVTPLPPSVPAASASSVFRQTRSFFNRLFNRNPEKVEPDRKTKEEELIGAEVEQRVNIHGSGKKFGRYEIMGELGIGGIAIVYHAYDPMFEHEVALKILKPELLEDPDLRDRFELVKLVAKLEHVAIVPVYDVGSDNGQLYYSMRYMTGGSLSERIEEGNITLEQVARLLLRLADALDYAHRKGIIHRDLKPSSILFDEVGDAFISSFDFAKFPRAATRIAEESGMSGIIGTPRYMSPEQAIGEDIDGRSDQYSLAVIMFELLSGKPLFEAVTPLALAFKHATEPAPSILHINPSLPPAMGDIFQKVLQKEPADRYQTCTDFANAFIKALPVDTKSKIIKPLLPKVQASDIPTQPPPRAQTAGASTVFRQTRSFINRLFNRSPEKLEPERRGIKIFISYSRKDIEFGQKLVSALDNAGVQAWIDWENIPKGEAWELEIEKGIKDADAFVFLISPDSAKSRFCQREIEYAVKNRKRIIPLLIHDISEKEVPAQLSHIQWISFRETHEFDEALQRLLIVLNTNLA